MIARDYALGMKDMLKEGNTLESLLTSLESVLARRGQEKLKPRILRELSRLLEKHDEHQTVVIVTNEDDLHTFKDEIKDAEHALKVTGKTVPVTDPSIVGGFIVRTQNAQIDRSYKRALIDLYRNITTNR